MIPFLQKVELACGAQVGANQGIEVLDGAPSITTNRLYNENGTLYFDGSPIGSTSDAGAVKLTSISQIAHGFQVGDLVRYNGTSYVKSIADVITNAEVTGIVSNITTDTFDLTVCGLVTGLTGLTAGHIYFLSDITAGAYSGTEPSDIDHVSKPILAALSTTEAIFQNMRGYVITTASGASVRNEVEYTTGSTVPGGNDTGSITVPKSYAITRVVTDYPARVRVYLSAAQRDADISRLVTQDPTGDHGCVMETVTTESMLSISLMPVAIGSSPDESTTAYITVENKDSVNRSIVVSMLALTLEA